MTQIAGIEELSAVHPDVQPDQRHLLDNGLWDRLVGRIVKDEQVPPELAARILNEALRFLRLCAVQPGRRFAPSPLVDVGWHTFILYTRDYAAFCERVAGRFLHHAPTDDGRDKDPAVLVRTVAALRALDGVIDEMLWPTPTASGVSCIGCMGCDSSCTDCTGCTGCWSS